MDILRIASAFVIEPLGIFHFRFTFFIGLNPSEDPWIDNVGLMIGLFCHRLVGRYPYKYLLMTTTSIDLSESWFTSFRQARGLIHQDPNAESAPFQDWLN